MTEAEMAWTPGPVHASNQGDSFHLVQDGGGWFLEISAGYPLNKFPAPGDVASQLEADVRLIAEAFNVATETGMTPRKLAQWAAQMQAALQQIRADAAIKHNGGAWAAGIAALCLGTLAEGPASNDAIAERAAQRDELLAALRNLRNEVDGQYRVAEASIRQELGNTNYQCVMNRLDEADRVLARAEASATGGG